EAAVLLGAPLPRPGRGVRTRGGALERSGRPLDGPVPRGAPVHRSPEKPRRGAAADGPRRAAGAKRSSDPRGARAPLPTREASPRAGHGARAAGRPHVVAEPAHRPLPPDWTALRGAARQRRSGPRLVQEGAGG